MKSRALNKPLSKLFAGLGIFIGQVATPTIVVLQALDSASAVFPPLKGALELVNFIITSVNDFKTNSGEWKAFGKFVHSAWNQLHAQLSSDGKVDDRFVNLQRTLEKIRCSIVARQNESTMRRFWYWMSDPTLIGSLRTQLQFAIDMFLVGNLSSIHQTTSKLVAAMDLENMGQTADVAAQLIGQQLAGVLRIHKLPITPGSSWNKDVDSKHYRRNHILDPIMAWICAPANANTAQIYLLRGPADCGKTAVAHSVSAMCDADNMLAATYFYNKDSSPHSHIFTTIAQGLSSLGPDVRNTLITTLAMSPQFPDTNLSTQFSDMIAKPLQKSSPNKNMVVIIDGLDQEHNHDVLRVLREQVPLLPNHIRFFITTGPSPHILTRLAAPHIHINNFDVSASQLDNDIGHYIRQRLEKIAQDRGFAVQRRYLKALVSNADMSFSRAAEICDTLERSGTPKEMVSELARAHRSKENGVDESLPAEFPARRFHPPQIACYS